VVAAHDEVGGEVAVHVAAGRHRAAQRRARDQPYVALELQGGQSVQDRVERVDVDRALLAGEKGVAHEHVRNASSSPSLSKSSNTKPNQTSSTVSPASSARSSKLPSPRLR